MKRVESTAISNLADLLDLAQEDTILLRTPEGQEFIVSSEVEDFEAELESLRNNKEFMEFLDERSREEKTYSLAEVKKHLGLD